MPSLITIALLALVPAAVVLGGEGSGPSGPTSSSQAAGYSCDTTQCVLPSCHCASTSPPGNLSPADTPQFITFTSDDAVEIYTTEAINHFLASRKNPNNCTVKSTYFVSLSYTNYSMITDWYNAGNEIADHTMTHVGAPPASEIQGNLKAINAFSGVPVSAIRGFRAPFLNYSVDTLTQLHTDGFLYDSSATSASLANATDTDAFWPYTLDNGLANDCLSVTGICQGQPKLPGLWEIPLYATFEPNNPANIHLMDPWLDTSANDTASVLSWLQYTFLTHYNGNRQPFGLYTHPIHLAVGYPGVPDPIQQRALVNTFLDWAQQFPNVWIVTNQQLLGWMQNPVSNANIAQSTALTCSTPNVDPTLKVCNGIEANEQGLLINCPFIDFPWTTCYGCPVSQPSPALPVPAQNTSLGVRYHLPTTCSTPFWDPLGNKCLCTSSQCAFTDNTGPIGNYAPTVDSGSNSTTGSNSTSGGGGTATGSSGHSGAFSLKDGLGLSFLLGAALMAVGVAAF